MLNVFSLAILLRLFVLFCLTKFLDNPKIRCKKLLCFLAKALTRLVFKSNRALPGTFTTLRWCHRKALRKGARGSAIAEVSGVRSLR